MFVMLMIKYLFLYKKRQVASASENCHDKRKASALRPPTEMGFEENIAANWRAFKDDFDIYVAAACPNADDKTISYLAGEETLERVWTFVYGVINL